MNSKHPATSSATAMGGSLQPALLLGYDIGSSSVKASLVDAETGVCVASAFYPKQEAPITATQKGWAEQRPDDWWAYLKAATKEVIAGSGQPAGQPLPVAAIGISYQMHGLVCVDDAGRPLRDAIIWCDSRAVPYGEHAFRHLGEAQCLSHLLNSPGNFTASKLAWVKEHEPEVYSRIHKVMLPGDYIALRLTGEMGTTISGLSEGTLWDFHDNGPARFLLDFFGIAEDKLCPLLPTFGEQGRLSASAAAELGLLAGAPVTYRAGDQPNNALSLDVFEPGEVAATAGTSGVVYGVTDQLAYDPQSRVNIFAHVNHSPQSSLRLGILLCINGTGILNSWCHRHIAPQLTYAEMNDVAMQAPIGADGLCVLPFGNGAERVLCNHEPGASFHGLNFNRHSQSHLLRAAQEGIAFSFAYGMKVMEGMKASFSTIRAGRANMFLSPLFATTLASVTGATIELCETDGSVGAAKGAGIGAGIYRDHHEAFATLQRVQVIKPDATHAEAYAEAYDRWVNILHALRQ